jgi:hypothetical protein
LQHLELHRIVDPAAFAPELDIDSIQPRQNRLVVRSLASIMILSALVISGCAGGPARMAQTQAATADHSSATAKPEISGPSIRRVAPVLPPGGTRGRLTQLLFTEPILPVQNASTAASFVNQIGVVTHLSYTDTPYYTNFPQIVSALQTLGVRHIRDGYYPWPASSPIIQNHQQLASAGITTDYVVPYDLSTTPAAIESFAAEVGDVESLEAPNECDVSGACGANGIADVVSFLPVVNAAAKALNVPAVGPSFAQQQSYAAAGDIASEISVNNLHLYFGGRNPGSNGWGGDDAEGNSYGSFAYWLDMANADGPELSSEITESGYMSYPATSTPYTVPDSVAASYVPRTLLLAFQHGFKETFLYELIDEVSSPGYGLLNADLSPKPAYTAVQNLIATLSDDGGNFTPGVLPYTIAGGDSNLKQLLLEKSDGSFWLVVWLEESSWDPVNCVPIPVAPENIGIELGNSYHATTDYQFDSNGNVTPVDQPMNGNQASLTVTDNISIVEIKHN